MNATLNGQARGDPEDILDFWFAGVDDAGPIPKDRMAIWFGGGPELDRNLRERFGADHARAVRGELDAWRQTPRGTLALVLFLDQLSRNLHRGTAAAFEADAKALAVSRAAIARGDDRQLKAWERSFLYMPFMHAEDRAAQAEGLRLFEALAREAPPAHREGLQSGHDFAVRHAAIVERFGRFPHRNGALERTSTAEEVEFLKQPGSAF